MHTKAIRILAPHGLHLRVAARIVQHTKTSRSRIVFHKDGKTAHASSILDLLVLAAGERSVITVTASGEDEQQAVEKIAEILMDGAGI